jgi:sugar phosphate isomerase/epimerase
MAIDIAGPYLAEVHVKNLFYQRKENGKWAPRYCPLDQGIVSWEEVIKELRQAGYNGWLMLEDFYTDFPVTERLAHSSKYLRELLNRF